MNYYPNILLIAGNGRNVGKTTLACRVIAQLAKTTEVYAVKISSHFHVLDKEADILMETSDCCIVNETLDSSKDSSRMLKAGATTVFYVQCKNEHLPVMFEQLRQLLPMDKPLIIESGGLYNILEPSIFYYIRGKDTSKEKLVREGRSRINVTPDEAAGLDIEKIAFINGGITKTKQS
ncbi:hypothetical protein SAMN06265379_11359 [Saccharicrinis carchari]|uniref:Molybdopterin-guanine dinucleotide biosynthesis protein B n=1 Tax=Saccharicrinis carchari TaxID=1168039 RepID=A0A521F2F5_SACCC|nr:molybdopterin-guanine dinucleotide biosynthesis protein B [Saccharicrinis carchari]SMO90297.1 hypothetical protein SAMN06265379_11359 [Saccharicrinis carchari]